MSNTRLSDKSSLNAINLHENKEIIEEKLVRKERKANSPWNKFRRNKAAVIGLVIVCIVVIVGILAPYIAPYNPNQLDVINTYAKPLQGEHFLGTDDLGRDLLSRLIYGARVSVVVAIGSTVLGSIAGVILGLISGFVGGKVDTVIMRIMDGMFAFPYILLSLLLVTVLGPGIFNVMLAIALGSVPSFARIVRGQTIIVKNEEYCNVERILGASKARIVFHHILPNVINTIVVYATLNIGSAIISEAALSYLGVGILIPTPSWGNILRDGREVLQTSPHVATFSGLCIFLTVIGFNLVGDGIRDVLDPKMKK